MAQGSNEAPTLVGRPRSPVDETSCAAEKHPRVADDYPPQPPRSGKCLFLGIREMVPLVWRKSRELINNCDVEMVRPQNGIRRRLGAGFLF